MVLGCFFLLVAAPTESLISGLVAVLAAAVVVAMVLQILVYREQGLVSRLSLALTGNVLLTLGFAVAFHLVGPLE
jgi:preprotein translocase subunit SecD